MQIRGGLYTAFGSCVCVDFSAFSFLTFTHTKKEKMMVCSVCVQMTSPQSEGI